VDDRPSRRTGEPCPRDGGRRAAELNYPLLLALDLSSDVGWALMRRYEPPRFGTKHLVGSYVERLGLYHEWLGPFIAQHKPDGISWEGAIKKPTDKVDKLVFLYGLIGITAGFRAAWKLPFVEVPITMAKKSLTGNSYADKDLMIACAMSILKLDVEDDHQADALAVGLVAYDNLWPK
jgi:Holliday junction resolvasome RuvABC endonuclease subunit